MFFRKCNSDTYKRRAEEWEKEANKQRLRAEKAEVQLWVEKTKRNGDKNERQI